MISVRKALVLATAFSACSVVHALPIPINDGTLEYEGALFTLQAEGSGTHYTVTYWADFTNFTNAAAQPIFYALDWKWGDGIITSISLTSAPGGTGDWTVPVVGNKINNSAASLNCGTGGGSGAACTQFMTVGNGIDTASKPGNLSWVFDVYFQSAIDVTDVVGNTLRGGYVFSNGNKAGAIMSCTTGVNDLCSVYEPPPPPDEPNEPNTPVPIPGTLMLLGIGLAAMRQRLTKRS